MSPPPKTCATTDWVYDQLQDQLRSALRQVFSDQGWDQSAVSEVAISPAPDRIEGDYGLHCGQLAKQLAQPAPQLAQRLAAEMALPASGVFRRYLAVGPYLNVKLNFPAIAPQVVSQVLTAGSWYGCADQGQNQTYVIDMSAPNIAKRMSIGHLRSTIIGDSLYRLLTFQGFRVLRDNHLGDWGTQFGHLLYALELWGDEARPELEKQPIATLQQLYVRISRAGDPQDEQYAHLEPAEAKLQAEQVKDQGRAWFKKLEQGDGEARRLWQQIVDWSMTEFQQVYDLLKIEFELVHGESFYEPMLAPTIAALRETSTATDSQGAVVVDMDDVGLGVAIVQKSDGATLYITRDIATALHRANQLQADGMIYVVGEDQRFYFQQLFEVLRRMGLEIAGRSYHLPFGMIRLEEGKMSTRKGRVVLLEEVVDKVLAQAQQLIADRTRIAPEQRPEVVRQVGVGALKWNDLKRDPKYPIIFDWDQMLSLTGNSAPYVQYACVRAGSILQEVERQHGPPPDEATGLVPAELDEERALIKKLTEFPLVVRQAAGGYNPSLVAAYAYQLAQLYNSFYNPDVAPVLGAETPEVMWGRYLLTKAVAQVLTTSLMLLGIEVPAKM